LISFVFQRPGRVDRWGKGKEEGAPIKKAGVFGCHAPHRQKASWKESREPKGYIPDHLQPFQSIKKATSRSPGAAI
jgi:CRISPR/Cas system-associated endonuclease/helicase Cas3